MSHKQMKLEKPERVAELAPKSTLLKIGLHNGHVFVDIGAGSGLFTLPAARITAGDVYALETDLSMLALIREKADQEGLTNIRTVPVQGDTFAVPKETVDIALLATVLHEIDDKATFLKNIWELLKPGGKLSIIEFRKEKTPMGPDPARRMSADQIMSTAVSAGFTPEQEFELGPNFICWVFKK